MAALMVGGLSLSVIAAPPKAKRAQSVMPKGKGRAGLNKHSNSVLSDTTSFSQYKHDVQSRYERDRAAMIERFLAYRDSITREFAQSLGKEWEKKDSKKPVDIPKDNSVPPVIIGDDTKHEPQPAPEPQPEPTPEPQPAPEPKKDVEKEKPVIEEDAIPDNSTTRKPREAVRPTKVGKIKVQEIIAIPSIKNKVQPKPVVPVEIPKETIEETLAFDFYGSQVKIKIDDDCSFKLVSNDNVGVSKAVSQIGTSDKISEVLKDCLKAREELRLCDWAYYQLLTRLGTTFFGKECNEASLLTGYLYCMSGYKMRFAFESASRDLVLLVATEQSVTGRPYLTPDDNGMQYYIFGNKYPSSARFEYCNFSFPQEKAMSLWLKEEPSFTADNRLVKHRPYAAAQPVGYRVNKNLIDFFADYPVPYTQGDLYSTWTYYAQTPMSAEAQLTLYPQLRKQLEGKSLYEQLKTIMFFIEGYKYGYDNDIWGHDRAFFPDETIFYPMSDCEDHAILFTRLVRDLLHLPTAVIYYPGHLAAAVKVPEQIPGDYLTSSRGDYLVCDPTIYYSGPGVTMKSMEGKPAKLIIIED